MFRKRRNLKTEPASVPEEILGGDDADDQEKDADYRLRRLQNAWRPLAGWNGSGWVFLASGASFFTIPISFSSSSLMFVLQNGVTILVVISCDAPVG